MKISSPHRRPFRFIDEIIEVEFGKRAVCMLNDLTAPEYEWLKSHFPSFQVVPGAILLEALAEVGAIAILGLPENRNKVAVVAKADMSWRRPIIPGNLVQLETEITRLSPKYGRGYGRALINNDEVAADGTMTFAIIDKPSTL